MKKNRGNKGSTLVLVMIVVMVVALLADILIETSIQNYKISKASGYMDYSYYAADSAIQKCFDALKQLSDSTNLAEVYSIPFMGNKDEFAKNIVSNAFQLRINALIADNKFGNINVSDDVSNMASVKKIMLTYLGYSESNDHPGMINIKIGAEAASSYIVKPYVAGDKKVYAVKTFQVYVPDNFKLLGPVYSIGDMMSAGGSKVKVTGDVHVYGTSPEKLAQAKQYYYGGIYAKGNSEMHINGNAYCRSLIRTGEYSNALDTSRIYIYKDAVAQGIQVFGRGERIAVMRNAFTFDDVEMNGEDSVIAINGSYFGLSNGIAGKHHDDSSAIVNSAVIHHDGSEASMLSRIVINGASMVNGGTWRLELSDDTALHQIEDASIAWDNKNARPIYKEYNSSSVDYFKWLEGKGFVGSGNGFANLFQVWPSKKNLDALAPDGMEAAIADLFKNIDNARQAGSNSIVQPGKVEGYCNYIMAGNNRMYKMDKLDETESGLIKAGILKDNFQLDYTKTTWGTFWNSAVDGGYGGYCTNVPYLLENILKPELLNKANVFIKRYTYDAGNLASTLTIEHRSDGTIERTRNLLDSLVLSHPASKYIIKLKAADSADLGDASYAYNNPVNKPWAKDKSFLVINYDPDKVLFLDGKTFNGILFTLGKVVLKNKAVVNGAIIAAGRGFENDAACGFVSGSASDTQLSGGGSMAVRAPRVNSDGNNQNVLDSGGYAGVYCESGDVSICFPDRDGTKGRSILLDRFKTQDAADVIDLYNIF